MKTLHYLTIGDLHGSRAWMPAAPAWCARSIDHLVVFLGDYVDSRTIPLETQLTNLRQVFTLKRAFPAQVILLLGNHDAHYLWADAPRGSGFAVASHAALFPLLQEHAAQFRIAYQHDTPDGQRYLWTHAGVTDAWLDTVPPFNYEGADDAPPITLADALNFMAEAGRMRPHLLAVGKARGGHGPGGPLWADAQELTRPIPGYHQLVGHTALTDPWPLLAPGNATTSATLCDYNHLAPAAPGLAFFHQISLEAHHNLTNPKDGPQSH